ncbi:MAG: amidohydrolase family protein [Acidobacteria bacterium]|nr:amidohydrolase family protein [Acidobacteriota bacterium]
MRIIDVRCRVTIREAGDYFLNTAKQSGRFHTYRSRPLIEEIKSYAEGTMEAFLREIGEAGVHTAVSVSGQTPGGIVIGGQLKRARTMSNDLMARLQKENPGRIIGVAGIDAGNVLHKALDEIERSYQLGLRVVFIEPGRSPGCNVDDRRLYPIYEKCVEREMALIPQTSGPYAGKNMDCAHPFRLDTVAEDFPALRLVVGHGCYPFVREAIILAARHENVFVSPDMYVLHMGTEDWVKQVNNNFFGFQDQFLFGSCFPSVPIKPFMDEFWKLPWKEEVLPKILYRNALRALKLEDDPTFKEIYGI